MNAACFLPLSLSRRIEYCQTADEFYSTMGCLTQEMLEQNLISPTELMQVGLTKPFTPSTSLVMIDLSIINLTVLSSFLSICQEVYSIAVFPFPQLAELREKYTYNITPFPSSVKSNGRFVLNFIILRHFNSF